MAEGPPVTAEVPVRIPLVIYDGRCGFCGIWIDYWKALTADRVAYAPSQEAGSQYPQIPPRISASRFS